MRNILSEIKRHNTLVITNNPSAIRHGAGINFISNTGGKLEFEVKAINIIKRGIQVSVKIEELAIKKYS